MRKKTIATSLLLLFVFVCVVVLVAREIQDKSGASPGVADSSASPGSGNTKAAAKETDQKIIAYYFHGYQRCQTCLSIEAYAREALETGFPEALEKGRLEWRTVNMEAVSNRHYIDEYQLSSSSLILSSSSGNRNSKWKNLSEIWPLVHNKEAFVKYVRKETAEYLGEF